MGALAGALATLLGAAAAWAGIGTSSFTARVAVNTNCNIAAAPVAFGQYDPIGANRAADLNAAGLITVTCVKGTAPTIALGAGNYVSAGQRRMKNTSAESFLPYELYQPPSAAPSTPCSFPAMTPWGEAGAEVFAASAAQSKLMRTYNVCGTVRAAQNPAIGEYADTIVATVNF
ncbi:MAG TPA: spore coat U domain-containing protein [Burkholderiales bacterium]